MIFYAYVPTHLALAPVNRSVSLHKPKHAAPHCRVVPTDGVATMADHWCLTHDAPSAPDRCEDGPSKA